MGWSLRKFARFGTCTATEPPKKLMKPFISRCFAKALALTSKGAISFTSVPSLPLEQLKIHQQKFPCDLCIIRIHQRSVSNDSLTSPLQTICLGALAMRTVFKTLALVFTLCLGGQCLEKICLSKMLHTLLD